MVLNQKRHAVGSFSNRQDMEHALNELNNAGFIRSQIAVVASADLDDQLGGSGMTEPVQDKTQEGVALGAFIGAILGATGSLLVDLGILAVPEVGLVVAAGTAGTALATAIVGAGIVAATCGLIKTLAGLGVSPDPTSDDSDRFSQSEYLVMVDGTDEEMRRVESIFSRSCSSKVWVC